MKTLSPLFDEMRRLGATKSVAPDGVDTALDFEGRRWPTLSPIPRDRISELENTIEKLSTELALRCTQVADLYNIREQQANDLLISCDEIDRLGASVGALHDRIAVLENDAIPREKAFLQLDKENIGFRLELDKSRKEFAALLERLLGVETGFNDREIAIVSTQEKYAQMKTELIAALAEKFRNSQTIEDANRRHRDELNQQSAYFKEQITGLEGVAVERSRQIKTLQESEARLASRCESLDQIVHTLQHEKKCAQGKYGSHAVEVLETLLKVERENAENKIRELTAVLQHERVEYFNTERTSAGIRKNIVLLLPKLAALRSADASSELDPATHRNNAA